MIATCPDNEKLKSLTLGQLPEEQSDALLLHVQDCESCQSELGTIDDSQSANDTLIKQLKSPSSDSDGDFESENGCRVAITRALAALAAAEDQTNIANRASTNVPKSIGEYDIVRPLGHGGMGHVFLGQHTKLGRPVAIKFIAEHRRWDQSMHDRFASEMKLVGGLNHPNIVVAHDAREVDGLAVLVTEFIDGMTVSEILKRQGRLSIGQSCSIASEICKALTYIDSKGLVHRDIKPSNIIISNAGKVKLLDLGLARLQATDDEPGNFTATGQAMGTADYVAPEQVNDGRNVDIRADIYGLGCTLYKLLTGHAPFDGSEYASTFAKMNAHVSAEPESLGAMRSDLPKSLVRLVDQMLEKDPADRPQSPAETSKTLNQHLGAGDLASLVADSKLATPQATAPKPINSVPKTQPAFFDRNPWFTTIATALVMLAFGLWLGVIVTVKRPDGTTTSVEIPNGSTAVVDEAGNIEITLAGSSNKLQIPSKDVTLPSPTMKDTLAVIEAAQASSKPPAKTITTKADMAHAFTLPPESPLYKVVEKGDLVDYLVLLPGGDSQNPKSQWTMIQSKVPVIKTELASTIATVRLSKECQDRLSQLSFKVIESSIEFHDPSRAVELDRAKFDGVWRVIMRRTNKKIQPNAGEVVVFKNRQAIFIQNEKGFAQFNFDIDNEFGDQITFWEETQNTISMEESGVYKFLESGRLEISAALGGGNGKRFPESWRLERISKPESKAEKLAFEVIKSAETADKKLEFYIADSLGNDPNTKANVVTDKNGNMAELIGDPILTSSDLVSATAQEDKTNSEFSIRLELNSAAVERVNRKTSKNKGRSLAIVIDGKVQSLSNISMPISGKIVAIYGFKTKADAEQIAKAIVPIVKIPDELAKAPAVVRVKSSNNLKVITLAFHNHAAAHNVFPTSSNVDERRGFKPMSWRVAILPFVGENELYEQYDRRQAWDSQTNLKVLKQMPEVFKHPLAADDSTMTNYVGIADPNGILGTNEPHGFTDSTDGTSNTILVLEVRKEIPWTKPEDVSLDYFSKERIKNWDFMDEQGLTVATGDGAIQFIKSGSLSFEVLQNLLLMNDGNIVDWEAINNKR